ncbi:sigma-70 family RNA polymerase sigma factor [Aliikangiella coralliicola]|uniref:Sigma-70 family RNA polymerase sigma factor n=1 Tax=Aliikangiella coralliicola TaxID=2592383 RepID=A0A545UG83_9GAMM|nr:sigma-70 family RNA polymerase sigma factor [Aliikangiella coralliicola]TQV88482.1 sigma-70 family RNA polymerase sigma factor [Aliikangiella coralliicola]
MINRKRNHQPENSVTKLLVELSQGNKQAYEQLFPIVYSDLRQRAKQQRYNWYNQHTLNTSALINETYLKLVENNKVDWQCRSHFLTAAAKAMRHILIDHARQRSALKRGGEDQHIAIDEVINELHIEEKHIEDLLSLDKALRKLAQISKRESQIVECRVFAGMSLGETSAALGISKATVKRDWTIAQAWLLREMEC